MNFAVYLKNGWIKPHAPSPEEILRLLALADRDIRQSHAADLEPEWRFDIAYNAALQLAGAVLAASGYEAERLTKHMRTIECLPFAIPAFDAARVRFLNHCRAKRNTSVYEQIGMISEQEAAEMVAFSQWTRSLVRNWLKKSHPHLLKPSPPS